MLPNASDNHDADRALWRAFRNGDRDAFTALYEHHVYALVSYGEKIVPHREVVEDAIHDLFVDLWRRRRTLSDTSKVRLSALLQRNGIRGDGRTYGSVHEDRLQLGAQRSGAPSQNFCPQGSAVAKLPVPCNG